MRARRALLPGGVGSRSPGFELVACVVRVDHAADVPAPADLEAGEHELALTAAELGVVGTPVIGCRLRESLDCRHVLAFPSIGTRRSYGSFGERANRRVAPAQARCGRLNAPP